MKKILLPLFLALPLFALSPFSLEGFKEGNFKFIDKTKSISKETKQKIQTQFETQLSKVGIKLTSESFSNFLARVDAIKIGDTYTVTASLFIVENVSPTRNPELQSMAITYKKDDFFETNEFEKDVYDSLIDFLLFDFIEQYKEENDL